MEQAGAVSSTQHHKNIDVELVRRRRAFQLALAEAFKDAPTLYRVLKQTSSNEAGGVAPGRDGGGERGIGGRGRADMEDAVSPSRRSIATWRTTAMLFKDHVIVPSSVRMCSSRATFLSAARSRLDAYDEAQQHAARWRRERLELKRRKLALLHERYENGYRHTL